MIDLKPHPLLQLRWLRAEFPESLSMETPSSLVDSLRLNANSPFDVEEEIQKSVRDLLRQGGFKPSGRNKPASEYLIKAAEREALGSINAAVDICNVVSLHSGIPISVVDTELLEGDLRVEIASAGESYVFNPSGQILDLSGLICLFDERGACANAVKDSQRTKTHSATREVLYVFWAPIRFSERAGKALEWMQECLLSVGARVLETGCEVSS